MKQVFGLIASGLMLSFAALAQTPSNTDMQNSNMKPATSTDNSMNSMSSETTTTTTKEKKQKMEDDSGMREEGDSLNTKGSGSTSPSTEESTGY